MKIFLDTADTKTISKHFETGLIDGVTTNPTLIMKSHERPDDVYRDLVLMGLKDISMEVVGTRGEMLAEADRLSSLSQIPTARKALRFPLGGRTSWQQKHKTRCMLS